MSDITKENVSVETDDKVNAIREDDEMQNTINEKIDITTQGSSEETRTDLVTADAGNANSVGHPTITIKYQGLEWHLDRHNFMRNSELAVTTFGRDTKCYPHNEIMKVPDNAKGVSAQALDLMTNYFNDGAEAPAQWLTCHGGTEHKGPTWMSKIQKNPNALQDMPEHFTTAAYFQSRSLVVLLQLAASRSFIALICSKGRQQSLPSYALYTKAICEALGAAFDPSRCPYKVEGAREVAQVDGEAEKDEVGCEHQQPDTLCADELLNDAGWLRWVAEHEHLMALFWAEMAYKGQLSYGGGLGCAFLRWDRLEGESKWRTSPY
ncbi:hypothetical protein M406DRAFT_73439 [Cryphonectria parasitica EP155]|uniref:Uncharacterized protein n=1 Tax=Cryphonectria parasitica (strain ATCC 38755 / EP155) TaxID=660469 RepID=A0A9P5CKP3_CRYP1|nr:uncharacterized protein M406DRAFT_73439 [Cryphonectria parasitica EP155]KAF3760985.1 hypothetical protein M406DRAFT_73439 [Cryphonectria parasitica EP155]